MTRKEANFEILRLLANEFAQHPDVRFGQALRNLDVIKEKREDGKPVEWVNGFNEESETTFKRMMERMKNGHG